MSCSRSEAFLIRYPGPTDYNHKVRNASWWSRGLSNFTGECPEREAGGCCMLYASPVFSNIGKGRGYRGVCRYCSAALDIMVVPAVMFFFRGPFPGSKP